MTRICKKPHEGRFLRAGRPKSSRKVTEVVPDKVKRNLAEIPPAYRETYKRAMTGKSLRAAVNSFCLECVCWQREEVKLCTAIDCPLYPYRPYNK